jgi:hypothetical protein
MEDETTVIPKQTEGIALGFIQRTLLTLHEKHGYTLADCTQVFECLFDAADATRTLKPADLEMPLMEIYDGLVGILFGDNEEAE